MMIWVFVTAALVLGCTGAVWYIQRKNRARELADISTMLERILNDELLEADISVQETLFSKIQHQLCRLQRMTKGYHVQIENDRDSIKKLISEIAHQLRTPLTNIETYLTFLKDDTISSEEQKIYLEAVSDSEQKIHFLVESFIKMSRLENRIIQIRPDETDLCSTLNHAIWQIEKKAEGRGIALHREFPDDLNHVHDAGWLGEAIFNVLDNAVKYSEENSKIVIGAHKNEMSVCIWIRDYGMGIEADEESKVFQRFYRGKKAQKKEGFGLGLYLTREIVLLHGGFVRIKRMHPGTLVEIYLTETLS